MKKHLISIALVCLSYFVALGCSECNCYLGINPLYKKNFIGLRYRFNYYKGAHLSDDDLHDNNLLKSDFTESKSYSEIHGQWYPTPKIQVIYILPYSDSKEYYKDSLTDEHKGISDPTIIGNYQLYSSTIKDSSAFRQRLFVGLGVTIPIGKYHLADTIDPIEHVHLPGTGSFDFIGNLTYIAKYKRLGMNINATYKYNTTNKDGYKFANGINGNLNLFYTIKINKLDLMPSVGCYYQRYDYDLYNNAYLSNSGGTSILGQAGLNLYIGNIGVEFSYQSPIELKLNENQPHLQQRYIAGLNYAF